MKDNKTHKELLSPLFLKYSAEYEKNPQSRVFAPLAEMYRKVGMVDRAMEILAKGIRHHPTYVLGYLGMGQCYFDIGQFTLTYTTLRPFVESTRDNLKLQRLFADTALKLNKREEALETYKYLLFVSPKDKAVSELVRILESEDEASQAVYRNRNTTYTQSKNANPESPENRNFKKDKSDYDSWVDLQLYNDTKNLHTKSQGYIHNIHPEEQFVIENSIESIDKNADEVRDFKVVPGASGELSVNRAPLGSQEKLEIILDLSDEFEPVRDDVKAEAEAPIVTHTLVDLYIGQGHIEKALDLLEKIFLINPGDKKTENKILEIKQMLDDIKVEPILVKEQDVTQVTQVDPVEEASEFDLLNKELNSINLNINKYLVDLESDSDGDGVGDDEVDQVESQSKKGKNSRSRHRSQNQNSQRDHELKILYRKEFLLNAFLERIRSKSLEVKKSHEKNSHY